MIRTIKDRESLGVCTACQSGTLGETLFTIPELPLVDSFSRTLESALATPRVTVDIKSCTVCGTIQVENPVSPEEIYGDYIYESSSSPDLQRHFSEYKEDLLKRGLINTKSQRSVLEIGINDGLLAKEILRDTKSSVVGIDPSPQTLALKGELPKLEIINDYFSSKTLAANELGDRRFDLVIANNVLSHIPEMHRVLSTISSVLNESGVLVFEVQSVAHLLERRVFDYIYHEHIFYHSLASLSYLASQANLEIYDVSFFETKGGSYRIYAAKPGAMKSTAELRYYKYYESLIRPNHSSSWTLMTKYLESIKQDIVQQVQVFRERNPKGRILGYGACATGTVLQRYFGLENFVDAIIDDNSKRQGLFSPGFGKEVIGASSIGISDLVLVLAWRHYEYFKSKICSNQNIIPLHS